MYHEKREKAGENRRALSEMIMQQVHKLIKTVFDWSGWAKIRIIIG